MENYLRKVACISIFYFLSFSFLLTPLCFATDGYEGAKWGMSRKEVINVIGREGKKIVRDSSPSYIDAWGTALIETPWKKHEHNVEISYHFDSGGKLDEVSVSFTSQNTYEHVYEYLCYKYGEPTKKEKKIDRSQPHQIALDEPIQYPSSEYIEWRHGSIYLSANEDNRGNLFFCVVYKK
jgi:hypothetical protein